MTATFSTGKLLNSLSSTFTGGLVPDANIPVDISDWADALEPRRTPILSRCKKLSAVDQMKHEWGQSYHVPVSGTLSAAGMNNSVTTVPLATGQGAYIQAWFAIELIDVVVGTTRLDMTTREVVIVRSVDGTDTIASVQRAAMGTSAVSHTGTTCTWNVIGVAMPHTTDFQFSPFVRGDRLFNYSQRFYGMVGADSVARHTPNYEEKGDIMLRDFKEQTMLQKYFLEKAITAGGRQAGDANGTPTTTTQNPFTMGGIDYFITNHSGRVNNLSGRTLSAYDLEDVLADMYKEIDDGGAKTLLMSVDTARIFDTLLNPIREATVKDTSVNLHVDTLKFRWGSVEIQPTMHLQDGMILFVDFSKIGVYPRKGGNWSTEDVPTKGPYQQKAIWGEFGLRVTEVLRMGKIHNFNTDINAYPRREQF